MLHLGKLGIINILVPSIIKFLDAQHIFKYLRKKETNWLIRNKKNYLWAIIRIKIRFEKFEILLTKK